MLCFESALWITVAFLCSNCPNNVGLNLLVHHPFRCLKTVLETSLKQKQLSQPRLLKPITLYSCYHEVNVCAVHHCPFLILTSKFNVCFVLSSGHIRDVVFGL